jgi:hypothetical protein
LAVRAVAELHGVPDSTVGRNTIDESAPVRGVLPMPVHEPEVEDVRTGARHDSVIAARSAPDTAPGQVEPVHEAAALRNLAAPWRRSEPPDKRDAVIGTGRRRE